MVVLFCLFMCSEMVVQLGLVMLNLTLSCLWPAAAKLQRPPAAAWASKTFLVRYETCGNFGDKKLRVLVEFRSALGSFAAASPNPPRWLAALGRAGCPPTAHIAWPFPGLFSTPCYAAPPGKLTGIAGT